LRFLSVADPPGPLTRCQADRPPAGFVEYSSMPWWTSVAQNDADGHVMPGSPAGSISVIFQADLPPVGSAEVYTLPTMSAATQKDALGHDMPVIGVELRAGKLAVTFQTDFAPAVGLVETRISPCAAITQSLRLGHEILPAGTWVVAATQALGPPAG